VDDQKLSQYAQGTVKKSKREKEKEAAEAKRKEEEEHAAKAYAEFLDAFDADDSTSAPARRSAKSSSFVRPSKDSGSAYTPSGFSRSDAPSRPMRAFEPSKVCWHVDEREHSYITTVSISSSCAKAERQTCYGCIFRRDQEVRQNCATLVVVILTFDVATRDQADREARFARNCKLVMRFSCVNVDLTSRSSRTVRDCYGR